MPGREDGTPNKAHEDELKVSSSGVSSEFPMLMHALDIMPAKEDGPPDKATEDGLKVSSSGTSSELRLPMHALTHTRKDCLSN